LEGSACGYGASKHAMAGFFDSLRIELADSGINVTTIYPGWVTTGISSRAIGADGKPVGKSTGHEKGAMAADACARLILEAIAKRKREVVMTLLGKVGLWLKLIAPGVVEQVV
jgi:short-subunit dehydrogenase